MKIIKVYKSLSAFLFYLTLTAIIAGINFSDVRSPGWFIQPLPVGDQFNDLFFIDSLRGWMVGNSYIIHSYNGGYNWIVQKNELQMFNRVQFLDTNYGYVVGGSSLANIQKTTNGGLNWIDVSGINNTGIQDLFFVNKDTGWVVINIGFLEGGLYRTTNGGLNWALQRFDQHAYDICFINKDTGWYSTNDGPGQLYRTINGGINWTLQFTAPSNNSIPYIYFINGIKGWVQAGSGSQIMYTTNGGFNWIISQGIDPSGNNIIFINENIGYSGTGFNPPKISKSSDGGMTWGRQYTPIATGTLMTALRNDTSKAWAGQLMHTTDGGGPIIYTGIIKGEHFIPAVELQQNYPNPFNPSTKIKFAVYRISYVELIVYDINGREIETLLDNKLFNFSCIYEVDFDANEYNLSSGVYFYKIKTETEDHKEIFIDTKKMLMIK